MRILAVLLLLAIATVAGCLNGGTDEAGGLEAGVRPIVPGEPFAQGADHDHGDPSQHRFLWHRDLVAEDRMQSGPDAYAGLHALDLQAGHLFGAAWGSSNTATDGGLYIWDLSDPYGPVQTAHFVIPGSVGGDRSVAATVDGHYVVITQEALTSFGQLSPLALINSFLVDVRDKSNPMVADVLLTTGQSLGGPTTTHDTPVVLGQHAVTIHRISDEDYAFIWGKIYHIDRSSTPASLVYQTRIPVGHDLYIKDTPWGDVWGLTANGFGALAVWNINDPANPVRIADWDIPDRSELDTNYYLHTADAMFFDDQAIVILTSEDWQAQPSNMWIFDADALRGGGPGELELIGQWSNPWNVGAQDLVFSMHNPRFHPDGILSLTHYHGGILELDFRHPSFRAEPALISYAVWAPDGGPEDRDPAHGTVQDQISVLPTRHFVPIAMDQEWGVDGILYVADAANGLQVFAPSADHPVFGPLHQESHSHEGNSS